MPQFTRNRSNRSNRTRLSTRKTLPLAFLCAFTAGWQTTSGQAPTPQPTPQSAAERHQSERSDKLTGGRVEVAEFEPAQPDIRITLNVPSFRLTLWQNGKEVKSYFVGVGMKEHPIYVGDRKATDIIWNPDWIPPSSNWVREMSGVSPGEVIKASDPRNPLGKMKIPLGDSYLIHQAKGTGDLGNLVSHGCVRMLRSELYDLADKLIEARSAPVSRKRIDAAKRGSRMLVVRLGDEVPVDINYDTIVVEERVLHIYPDIYSRGTNRIAALREELESAGLDTSKLTDRSLRQILSRVTRRTQFVVDLRSIEQGRALQDGKAVPLIPKRKRQKEK